jgi:teichuronic acid biosynthesis glycosyltransferase TuaH
MNTASARRPVIVLANDPWHAQWRRKQQLYSRLAALRPVYYIDPPFSALDFLRGDRPLSAHRDPGIRVTIEPCGVRRVDGVAGIPAERFAGLIQLANAARQRRWASRCLALLARDGQARDPIIICYEPLLQPLSALGPARARIYDAIDDYAALCRSRIARQRIRRAMDHLASECTLTLAANEALGTRLASSAREVRTLPQGVDTALFRPGAQAGSRFADVAADRRVKAVFHGTLNERIDQAILKALADAGILLLLAGECAWSRRQLAALRAAGDVRMFGLLAPGEVAALVAAADVGIIPYRPIPGMESVATLKRLEFYAAGLPVVATDMEPYRACAQEIALASEPAGFVAAVRGAVERYAGAREQRIATALANTWDERVRQLDAWLPE